MEISLESDYNSPASFPYYSVLPATLDVQSLKQSKLWVLTPFTRISNRVNQIPRSLLLQALSQVRIPVGILLFFPIKKRFRKRKSEKQACSSERVVVGDHEHNFPVFFLFRSLHQTSSRVTLRCIRDWFHFTISTVRPSMNQTPRTAEE